jgi:peptidyl-prolyl cis-trans isomerase A (cyclophilin A)
VIRVVLVALVAALGGCGSTGPSPEVEGPSSPDSFRVHFETTAGEFVVTAHRRWAPGAADRFLELVEDGFFDGNRIFRVVPGYVVQWGIHDEAARNRQWEGREIRDEPVRVGNRRGRLAFARATPHTRSTQVYINVADNLHLDTLRWQGVTGFPAFAEVSEGMEVVDRFDSRWGNDPLEIREQLLEEGAVLLDERFPGLDVIRRARVLRRWPEGAPRP